MAKTSRRGLKICCAVTAIIIIILIVVAVVLYFTVFKPKEPRISTQSVTLERINFEISPFHLNVSLGITVSVDNPNYGSFKYQNSTAYVTYRGTTIAAAPIEHDMIPARGKHSISTTVVVQGEKMVTNPYFLGDLLAEVFNFTSSTTLYGKAAVLKIFKIRAKSYCTCDFSLVYLTQNVTAACTSKVKF